MKIAQLLIILLLVLLTSPVLSQIEYDYFVIDSNEVYVVQLKDRSEFIGQIISQDSVGYTMNTSSGVQVKIPKDRVKKMAIASSQERINAGLSGKKGVEGVSRYPYPNPTYQNYYFSKTAIPLERGSVYYRNTYVLVNSFEVGITNFLSIDAGFETITTLIVHEPIFYITPKINFKIFDNLYAGISHFTGSTPDLDDEERVTFGLLSGLVTYGTINENITLSISYPTLIPEADPVPSIRLAGMLRISGKFALVTDNWFLTQRDSPFNDEEGSNLYSYGVRFITSGASLDLAFLRSGFQSNGIGIGIPYASACAKF